METETVKIKPLLFLQGVYQASQGPFLAQMKAIVECNRSEVVLECHFLSPGPDDTSLEHEHGFIGDSLDRSQVMGDKKVGNSKFIL